MFEGLFFKTISNKAGQLGAFQFVAGWWGHQPARRAVGGVPPPTISLAVRQIEMRPAN